MIILYTIFSICEYCDYLPCFNNTTKLVDSAACLVSVAIATIIWTYFPLIFSPDHRLVISS